MKIGLVGPCASGKTTLKIALEDKGFAVRHIAQEHSFVKEMWQIMAKPDVLIYLDVSFQEISRRRKISWDHDVYETEKHRLRHARQHADLYIHTDGISPDEVLERVMGFLK